MSIDHAFEIGSDERCKLFLNISGLNKGGNEIDEVSANLYAYDSTTGVSKFTCSLSINDLGNLYYHLDKYSMIKSVVPKETGKFVEITGNTEGILSLLAATDTASLVPALKNIIRNKLSQDDINTILGRKESLIEFENKLSQGKSITEPEWQIFFEKNEWIFGYGLKYRYLKILQREAHVSGSDLDGGNEVISDFLLSDMRFTKLVELKKPSTSLFKNRKNRSDAWCLSNDLSDAVSQILSQKANWEINSQADNYTSEGNKITDLTRDVECILIIGSRSELSGSDKEKAVKLKTLELYRRNLRNIDIVLYDELFERAKFIVKNGLRE
ncbi:MAG: DUF4263 domain-containing protein [Proteobacteria bacterium]|nr:DUF4263 domain-containing protein [Pseudomonadota bacterium]